MDEKLKMHSINKVDENIRRIGELFPNCLTERLGEDGKPEACIDFDMLKQELSSVVVEGNEERYQFTWPDKKKSVLLANAPTSNTLRPRRDKSVCFDKTENLYIEGDNLEVLKLLQETYLEKIKVIYIDPPYNTGNDFVYNDDFSESASEYLSKSGQYDESGNQLVKNVDSNGRFHTDWLNMMFTRLKLSRDLLTPDGAIFISIDDNEQTNIKKLCEEIFGESNKVAEFVVIRAEGGGMAKQVIKGHDYLYVYAKDITKFLPLGKPKDVRGKIVERDGEKYWIQEDWLRKEFGKYGNCHYEEILECKGQAKLDEIDRGLKKGEYILIPKPNGMHIVGKLRNLKEDSSKFYSILKHLSANGIKDLQELQLNDFFSYPKPVSLIKEIISGMTLFSAKKGDIILDFFSGSATTAQAVLELNAEDGGNRHFIMVQLPERLENTTEQFRTICDVGEERIRRVGKKLQKPVEQITMDTEEKSPTIDIGFRVLSLDSSNMKDVYYNPADYVPSMFSLLTDNIKEDRTPEDLLFQIMLDLGVLLSSKIDETEIAEKKVFSVADGFLIACFDVELTDEVITEIAKKKPYYFVTRDHSMASDSVATNFDQIFATYSPETVRKVL